MKSKASVDLAALALLLNRGIERAEQADAAFGAEADASPASSRLPGRAKARQRAGSTGG